jgi:hypothetical protein
LILLALVVLDEHLIEILIGGPKDDSIDENPQFEGCVEETHLLIANPDEDILEFDDDHFLQEAFDLSHVPTLVT